MILVYLRNLYLKSMEKEYFKRAFEARYPYNNEPNNPKMGEIFVL
jgi:hypothetical protein